MYTYGTYAKKQLRGAMAFSATLTVSGISSIFAAVAGADVSVAWPLYAATAISAVGMGDCVAKLVKLINLDEKYKNRNMNDRNDPPSHKP